MVSDRIATEDYVDAEVAGIVDSAPGTLDTLNELAAALGDDANFATTVTTALGTKVPNTRTVNGHALSSDVTVTKGDVGLGNVDNTADSAKAFSGSQITSGTVADARIDSAIARDSEVTSAVAAEATARDAAIAVEAALARNADNLTSGTVADARIASTLARDSEVTAAVGAEATARDAAIAVEAALARNADNLTSGSVADARIAATIARDSEVTAAVAAEAALARNADNLSSGTVADARIASTIARDSEVTSAVSAEATARDAAIAVEAALARNADNLTSGTVADARIASTIARDSEVAAGYQPLDSDLTAFAALTPTNDDFVQRKSGVWVNRSMAQLKTDLVLVKGDVGLGNVDNTSNATERAASATLTNKTLTSPVLNTPTGLVKGDVGLGNVDNTSNATERAASATLTNKTLTSPTIGGSIISALNWQPSGRLSLSTGVPVPTTDTLAATTVYYTPYRGNLIPLWNGTTWTTIPFSEKSLSLSGFTADSNYDIFGFLSAGDLALEALIWTNATTRATALTLTDGFYTKSGDQTRHYLGTIRITATTGQCESSLLKRYLWNNYNRVTRALQVSTATSHTYGLTTTIRQWNNDTANQVTFVIGLLEDAPLLAWVADCVTDIATQAVTVRATMDSVTSGASSIPGGAIVNQGTSRFRVGNAGPMKLETIAAVGYHYVALTEQATATATGTFSSAALYLSMMM